MLDFPSTEKRPEQEEVRQEKETPKLKDTTMTYETAPVTNVFKAGHDRDNNDNLAPLIAAMAIGNNNNGFGRGGYGGYGGEAGFAGLGGGAGALVGALVGSAMGGNGGGIFGGRGNDNGAETRIQDGQQALAVLTKLASIEAAVPLMGAQVANALNQQIAGVNQNISTVNQNVLTSRGDVLAAIAASTNTITSKIDANRISELEAELSNTRYRGHSKEVEVNVAQTVNQNQLQLQAQAQLQDQRLMNERICSALNGLQVATATNSNLIIGNTGASTTGAQTASPINTRL